MAAYGAKVNEYILAGEYWRFLTPVFLHGSILHIAFNMYALKALGPGLERHYGRIRFLILYLLSGFAGVVFSFLFSKDASLGSSTAIFGLLAAEGVFVYRNRRMFGETAKRALREIITIAGVNLLIGLSPGIDNWGHVGGLLGGALFAWLAGPVLDVRGLLPNLEMVDRRDNGDVWRAALVVGVVFSLLAASKFFTG